MAGTRGGHGRAAPSEERTQGEQLGKNRGLCSQRFHICKVGKQQSCNEK